MAFSNGGFKVNVMNMSWGKVRTNYFDLAHAYVDHSKSENGFNAMADVDLALSSEEVRSSIIRNNLVNWMFLMAGIFMVGMGMCLLC